MAKPPIKEHLATLALLLSVGMIAITLSRYKEARDALGRMESSFRRAQVTDRLTGRHLDVQTLGVNSAPGGPERAERRTLLWVVDVENCRGCFAELGSWRRLEQLTDHRLIILFLGPPPARLQPSLKLLKRTIVGSTTKQLVSATMGPLLPSTKVLLDAEGIAIMVDSRTSSQECGWSFDAQVGAVEGINEPRAIRLAARSTD